MQMVTAALKLRCLLLGRIVMSKLDSVLKSRDIILPTKVCLVKARFFQSSYMDVRVVPQRLSTEEPMLSNYGVVKDPCESLGLQGDQICQS